MLKSAIRRLLLTAVASWATQAGAIDTTWTFNGSGNWNTAANWSNGEPTNNTFNVFIDDGDSAVTVTLNLNRTIGNLTIGANDTLLFGETFDLAVQGSTVTNHGSIRLNAAGVPNFNTDFDVQGPVTLAGSGILAMTGAQQNRIAGSFGMNRELINTATHTIAGGGQLGVNGIKITNQGLIDANIAGSMILVDPDATGLTNTGTMQASGGGALRFQGGVFTNTGGVIRALNGSAVELMGGSGGGAMTVVGGTLATEGTGVIRTIIADGGVTLQDVTLTAGSQFQFGTNLDADIVGTFTNNGAVDQPSNGGTMQAGIFGNTTFTGSGTWTLSGNGNSSLRSISGNATVLTNDVGHTIQGTGTIGAQGLNLNNKGTIIATQATPLTLGAGSVGNVNSGTLRATNGGTLTVQGVLTSTGGKIEALDASAVNVNVISAFDGDTFSTTGSGTIRLNNIHTLKDVTINGLVRIANGVDPLLRGTITNNGTVEQNSTGGETAAQIDGNVTLAGVGVWKMTNNDNNVFRRTGANPALVLTNGAGHTIQGGGRIGLDQIGFVNQGLVDADQTTAITIDPSTANVVNQSTGVFRARGAGGLSLTGGAFDNQGTIEALNGSNVTYSATGVTSNNVAGVLTGGAWRSVASGGGATITLRGDNITQIAAGTTVELNGAGAAIGVQTGANNAPLESTLTANNGTVRILGGRNYAAVPAAAFVNGGTLELGGGTFNSTVLTNSAGSEIRGFGTIAPRPVNSGTIRATGGTLAMSAGIQGGGTVRTDAGATLDLSGGAQGSSADTLIHNGAGLVLGANNFSVGIDYQNANFGVGNAFNPRANVTGAGQILASPGVTQTLSGNVTGGGTATATMAFGNVHVGDSPVRNYQIVNGGVTGPSLRGAIQTTGGGASLTDGRLGGAGVTASNFGPIAAAASSANLGVTFNATSAGALTGQQVRIANNFDNVGEQILQITGAAYRFANPLTNIPDPVNFGIVHVGDVVQTGLSIRNDALPNDGFSERLNASIGSPTGGATTNGGSITGLVPGVFDTTSLAVGINTATAGVKTGAATISFTSSGVGTSGLADTALAGKTVNVQATVNNFAVANIVKSSGVGTLTSTGPNAYTLNLGTTVQGQASLTATLGVLNNVAAPADSLAGSFTLATPGYSLTGFNAFSNLAAGATQGGLSVMLPSTSAGTITGQITLAPQSTNPRPFSMNLPNVTINLTGRVFLQGDFDQDGDVDGDDLADWRAGFGMTAGAEHTDGDANGDGAVDGADLLVWQRQLGSIAAIGPALAAVPEPCAAALGIVGVVAGYSRRRRG